ncbi:putative ethanolamine phosphotransferase [Trypanosoma rangeli]|uniref:Putative ethanolamine phosphotransferase n=1 Tax=Trypanosoma rangeli TaxID=5698 RepID=A0A3R7MBN8_TRYRA|nr:putative ethanolamine phosphotransferase [Trypanosoma rangeli]RNF12456.1 putative ethanolamine phosphotransferase [Trypanosoma rangeli]|eukprot:RNF12456.1 putative ethanolamine phosphotransferase [Trypanosoma rangeli]
MERFHNLAYHLRVALLVALLLIGGFIFIDSMFSTSVISRKQSTEVCRGVRPVDQVVVLLVDALRPDFVLPRLSHHYGNGKECSAAGVRNTLPAYKHGRTLKYIEKNLQDAANPSHGFFFYADFPTVTCQRLQAMTAGTVPAFLELKGNINTNAMETDSLLHKLQQRSILYGDNAWLNIFPDNDNTTVWKKTLGFSTLDVIDLDTADETVLRHLPSLLLEETIEKAPSDYAKLIIVHFMGIDHAGHTFNAYHPEMQRVLGRTDEALHNVSRILKQRNTSMRTLLLLLGDHGMTNNGDHGGDSFPETDSFLYAEMFNGDHKPSSNSETAASLAAAAAKSLRRRSELTEARWAEGLDADLRASKPCREISGVNLNQLSAAHQVDLVPSISALLGVSIPFSNLGRIIPELIMLADPEADLDKLEECNWRQVKTFFEEAKFPKSAVWENETIPWRERLVMMSYFGRKTRNQMNPGGIFLGLCFIMVAALSIMRNDDVLQCLRSKRLTGMWTMLLFVMRLCALLSNSFIEKEDVWMLCLLEVLLLTALLATSQKRASPLLYVLPVALRVMVPLLGRSLSDIDTVSGVVSPLEEWMSTHAAGLQWEYTGLVISAVVFLLASLRNFDRLWVMAQVSLMAVCYNRLILHHIAPLLFFVLTVFVRGGSHLRYMAVVLWAASLCSDKYLVSAVIAIYGALLPFVVRAISHLPILSQAVLLHFFSWVAFYSQGNKCFLPTVDLNAFFVGSSPEYVVFGGILVVVRTLNAFCFLPMAVMSVYKTQRAYGWYLCYLLVYLAVMQTAVSFFNAYVQKSHLMLFSIFCPKLMFDFAAAGLIIVGYAVATLVM